MFFDFFRHSIPDALYVEFPKLTWPGCMAWMALSQVRWKGWNGLTQGLQTIQRQHLYECGPISHDRIGCKTDSHKTVGRCQFLEVFAISTPNFPCSTSSHVSHADDMSSTFVHIIDHHCQVFHSAWKLWL